MAAAGLAQTQRQTVHRYYVGDGIDGAPERGSAESFRSLEAALTAIDEQYGELGPSETPSQIDRLEIAILGRSSTPTKLRRPTYQFYFDTDHLNQKGVPLFFENHLAPFIVENLP